MMAARVCSVVLLLCTYIAAQSMDRVVQIDQGPVRGYRSDNGDYYSFFGIPYATAPTGRDKFKAAQAPRSWTETFEATNDLIICPQQLFTTQEDCLVVNVHVPAATNQQGLLPVLFYIHGGGFVMGYGTMVSPELLVQDGIIFVTINYRLGATGFLSLHTADIPGNAGFKDQVAALRWVQRNIANFGGNPNDVTIAGFSGGSISVEYMMLSPMARGLFHKAISESGSVLSPLSEGRDARGFASRFVSDMAGQPVEDLLEVEDYLLNATSAQLITDMYDSYQTQTDFSMGFTLYVEHEMRGVESFLTERPLKILKSGNYNKVPYMTGFTNREGILLLPNFDDLKPKMNENFAQFLPNGLRFPSDDEKNEVVNRLKQFYFLGNPVSDETITSYVNYMTDAIFAYSQIHSAILHASNSVPVYLYYYSYVVSEYPPHPHDDKIRGAGHCAQSFCVHRIRFMYNPVNESENDILMRDRLVMMWSNFIKHGEPVLETSPLLPVMWQRLDTDITNYLSMHVDMRMFNRLLQGTYDLWDDIYEKYYDSFSPGLAPGSILVLFSVVLAMLF